MSPACAEPGQREQGEYIDVALAGDTPLMITIVSPGTTRPASGSLKERDHRDQRVRIGPRVDPIVPTMISSCGGRTIPCAIQDEREG